MRTLTLALGLLTSLALTGCDFWHKPPPPKPVTVNCNCAAPAAAPAAVASEDTPRVQPVRHRRHHGAHRGYRAHYGHGSRRYEWHKRYAERSVDIYNYSSSSQHYGAHGYAHGEAYGYGAYGEGHGAGGCCEHGGRRAGRFGETKRVWADGYGRRHIYDESARRHYAYQARQRIAQTPDRLDPWHAYDEDWDWRTDGRCSDYAGCDRSDARYLQPGRP